MPVVQPAERRSSKTCGGAFECHHEAAPGTPGRAGRAGAVGGSAPALFASRHRSPWLRAPTVAAWVAPTTPSRSCPTSGRPTSSSAWSRPSSATSPATSPCSTSPTRSLPTTCGPASLALVRAIQYLPSGVVVAVVDPGVGTQRRAIAVEVAGGEGVLVGPDNGLLAPAAAMAGGAERAVSLTDTSYHLAAPGATFAGRDVFAPVAAHLCNGVDLAELGEAGRPRHPAPPGRAGVAGGGRRAGRRGALGRPLRQRPAERRSRGRRRLGRPDPAPVRRHRAHRRRRGLVRPDRWRRSGWWSTPTGSWPCASTGGRPPTSSTSARATRCAWPGWTSPTAAASPRRCRSDSGPASATGEHRSGERRSGDCSDPASTDPASLIRPASSRSAPAGSATHDGAPSPAADRPVPSTPCGPRPPSPSPCCWWRCSWPASCSCSCCADAVPGPRPLAVRDGSVRDRDLSGGTSGVNLATIIDPHPDDATALVTHGRAVTYGELRRDVAALRGGLAGLGRRRG